MQRQRLSDLSPDGGTEEDFVLLMVGELRRRRACA